MPQLPGSAPPEKPPNTQVALGVLDDLEAAVAVEYALLGAVMALIAIGGLTLFGDAADDLWLWLSGELSGAMTQ